MSRWGKGVVRRILRKHSKAARLRDSARSVNRPPQFAEAQRTVVSQFVRPEVRSEHLFTTDLVYGRAGALQSPSMNDISTSQLASKIARLIEERGWNVEEFARRAKLNRLTVRQIMLDGRQRLRNATVGACAGALGLSVNELRTQPLERLLQRMRPISA